MGRVFLSSRSAAVCSIHITKRVFHRTHWFCVLMKHAIHQFFCCQPCTYTCRQHIYPTDILLSCSPCELNKTLPNECTGLCTHSSMPSDKQCSKQRLCKGVPVTIALVQSTSGVYLNGCLTDHKGGHLCDREDNLLQDHLEIPLMSASAGDSAHTGNNATVGAKQTINNHGPVCMFPTNFKIAQVRKIAKQARATALPLPMHALCREPLTP
jgi:hypothetical protein